MAKSIVDASALITAKKMHQLNAKDLLKIYNSVTTYKGAWLLYQRLKKLIGKQEHQCLTVGDIAQWEGWEVQDVYTLLNL